MGTISPEIEARAQTGWGGQKKKKKIGAATEGTKGEKNNSKYQFRKLKK